MNTCDAIESETTTVGSGDIVHLPLGLLGFETIKEYLLVSDPEDAPFHWLQVLEDPHLGFFVLSPFEVMPDYALNLSDEDVAFLKIRGPEEVLVYNVVTLHPGGRATINLKGPIVLNRRTMTGKQVVLTDAARYALQHPLPTAE
jgi:flagellar assembly factor FliW